MNRREKRRKNKRVRRIVVWSVLALVVVFVVLTVVRNQAAGDAATDQANRRTYTVRLVSDRDTVEVSGNVEARDAHNHSFSTTRELVSLSVAVGDRVVAGQELARIDDTQERYNLANLDLTIEEERLSGSQRRLAVLELQRELRVDELQETVLTAEIAGRVVEVNADPGERVAAGASVVRVIDTSALVADVEINEYDLPLLSVGMPVEFTFDAVPDEVYMGRLSRLALEGRVNQQGLSVIDAQITLENPDPALIPSYSFLAEIVVSDTEEVLAVEEAAIFDGPRGTIALVVTEGSEQPVPTPVETEPLGDGLVEIVSGLEEGAELADPAVLAERSEQGGGLFPAGGGAGARGFRPPQGGGGR